MQYCPTHRPHFTCVEEEKAYFQAIIEEILCHCAEKNVRVPEMPIKHDGTGLWIHVRDVIGYLNALGGKDFTSHLRSLDERARKSKAAWEKWATVHSSATVRREIEDCAPISWSKVHSDFLKWLCPAGEGLSTRQIFPAPRNHERCSVYDNYTIGLHGVIKALVSCAELPEETTASVSEPVTFSCEEDGGVIKRIGVRVVVKAPHLLENLEAAYVILNNRR